MASVWATVRRTVMGCVDMIRCTLELIPGGIGEPEHLGTIEISNEVFRTIETSGLRGNYHYDMWKKRQGRKPWKKGRVRDFPRLAYHPWNLVREILNAVAEKNGGRI